VGCAASVRSALEKYDEVKIVELTPASTSGKFEFAEGFDYKTVLATLSETNKNINGWSVAE